MVKLPYVHQFPDRYGRKRYYFRKAGLPRATLPDPTDKARFAAAYSAALGRHAVSSRASESGTMAALVVEYLSSPEYKGLKPASKTSYNNILAWLREQPNVMQTPVSAVTRPMVRKLRAKLAEKPAKANLMMAVLRILLTFAMDNDYRSDNPALRITNFDGGEYRSWTDAELLQFEACWPRGTTERLIYELALYTGQRRGDISCMTWADVSDGGINVVQGKTGAKVWIPLHPSLQMELDRTRRANAVIVATDTGKSFHPSYLGARFGRAVDGAGLPDACVLHGLRKAAARRLAEAGCSEREIMAITGHATPEMVTHYTKQADQKIRARTGMGKVVRMDREHGSVKPVKLTEKDE